MIIKYFELPVSRIRIEYDNHCVKIQHDNDTGKFSWWYVVGYQNVGKKLNPIYK